MKRYLGIAAAALLALLASASALATDCIPSGVTDQYTYFVAVDSTDFTTRETGLSSFTVYRSRNGGAAAAFTTPTINETSSANMPGVYELLLDEDMTIDSGDDVQHMVVHITATGMAPVTKEFCIGRPKITAGNTLTVASDGDLTEVNTLTGNTVQTGDAYARLGAPAGASVSADILAVDNFVDDLESRLGTPSNLGGGATIAANLSDIEAQTDDIGAAGAGLTAADDAVMARLGAPVGASLSADLQVIDTNVDDIETDTADMQPKLGTFSDLGAGATLSGNLEDMRDNGTATFDRSTDSLQAIRDRGDAAWTTGGGGSCPADAVCTTVATAPTTTTFTATAAPNDDTQLDGWAVLFTDNGDADSYCLRTISGTSSGTITYSSACPFTVAAGDTVALLPAFLDLGVDITSISGDATAADNLEAALDGTGGVTITAGLTGNVTGNLSGSVGSVTGAVGSVTGNVGGNVTGSVGTVNALAANSLTAAAAASDLGTELATATWASTTRLLTAGTNIVLAKGTGITGFNDLSTAQVNSEVDTALTDIHLDHLFATDYDPASKPGTATALLNELIESDAGVSRFTANALEQAPTGGGETLDAIADAVWDEVLSGHSDSGSTGEALANASSAGDPWATALPGAYSSGTAGNIIGNNLNATVSSRASQTSVDTVDGIVDNILLDTAEIGTAGAGLTNIDLPDQTMNITGNLTGNVSGSVGSVTGAVGSVTGNVGGNVVGSVASVTGAVGSVTGNVGGNVTGSVGSVVNLEQTALADAAVVNCVVNTANFAGSSTTVACILTDRDGGAITAASGDLEGKELLVLSGAQIYEGRFINDSTWDGANSELRLTLSRALPGTLADAVTAIIR